MRIRFLMCVIVVSVVAAAQENASVGDFTKSSTEHIIIRVEQPYIVRSIKGVITRQSAGATEPLHSVLLELEGPGGHRKIKRVTTDENGRFKLTHISAGTYKFKATLDGFQSVMGTIKVSQTAPKSNEIQIGMSIGV